MHDLIVMRHGQTEWNLAGRWQGRRDSPLTPEGEAQARRLGAMCARLGLGPATHRILASPQPRAARTAELAFGPGIPADPRLAEIDVGAWTGRVSADLRAAAALPPEADMMALYDLAPGGEGSTGLHARIAPFLQELAEPTILVTHGITGRMIRMLALGRPISDLSRLTGGQGIAYRIRDGIETRLTPTPEDAAAAT